MLCGASLVGRKLVLPLDILALCGRDLRQAMASSQSIVGDYALVMRVASVMISVIGSALVGWAFFGSQECGTSIEYPHARERIALSRCSPSRDHHTCRGAAVLNLCAMAAVRDTPGGAMRVDLPTWDN